ncbi:MAG: winged helix-turn-helix domain-containing protein [Nitrososphaerota archaeon]|nr:hypothetical protein [Nitrososphaerales archaeon]MDW8044161.1 winged helix-turn-helix domain-containing protein [Nitrososphaerota archaeon]
MVTYRTQIKIIADILTTARDYDNNNEGVGVTILLRKANLSYSRLMKILKELVKSGLMEEVIGDKTSRYRISDRGREFLEVYSRFEEFAQSFGLRL